MELLDKNDIKLHTKCERFDFNDPQVDPIKLFNDLRDAMCDFRGIGLAAPQVGVMLNVFVMGNPDERDLIVPVFNPTITTFGEHEENYEEGCLTFPGLWIKIKRPTQIRVRYTNAEGTTDAIRFDGLTARIFQHEYDHLQGVLMTDIAKPIWLEKAKKWKKSQDRKKNQQLTAQKRFDAQRVEMTK